MILGNLGKPGDRRDVSQFLPPFWKPVGIGG